MIDVDSLCPCTSGDSYKSCCRRFHRGVPVENALELMRSRFSAYALNLPEYIVETTHPASPEFSSNLFSWKRKLSRFCQSSQFKKLDILEFKERNSLATVTFVAYIYQGEHDVTFTEKSFFEKIRGRWLYRGGQLEEGRSPNMVTVGQLRLLPLAYYGEPILHKKAEEVSEITPDVKQLIEEMIETMDVADGIGLAAPQVHHSIRLFLIRTPIETPEGGYELGDIEVFINPVITRRSEETWTHAEGCLSIPNIREEVTRPTQIDVEYTNLEGVRVTKSFAGMGARVVLHEYDHIEGVLFIDRIDQERRKALEPSLKEICQRIHGERPL